MSEQLLLDLVSPLDLKVADDNVRQDPGKLDELVASIKAVGVIEPLIVERIDGEPLRVIAGSRRLAAAQLAGVENVPVIVRDGLDERARVELMLIENLQRAELAPLEEAEALRRLTAVGMSQREIADRIGRSQSHISKRIALLGLPEIARNALGKGSITVEDAVELAKLADPKRVAKVMKEKDDNWQRVSALVDRELRDVKIQEKRAPVIEKLEARGIKVLPATRIGYSGKQRPLKGHGHNELEITVKEHAGCEGHAAIVDESGKVVYLCAKPSLHESASEKKKASKETAEQRDRQRRTELVDALEANVEARREFAKKIVGRKVGLRDTLALLVAKNLRSSMYYEGSDAAKLLDLVHGTEQETVAVLRAHASDDKGLVQVALAIALAAGETAIEDAAWHPESFIEHLQFLSSQGYALSAEESEFVELCAKKAKRDA